MKKLCRVVMLPTKSSELYKYEPADENNLIYYRKGIVSELDENIKPQHIYLTSDEEIKEGDYRTHLSIDDMGKESTVMVRHDEYGKMCSQAKKIIATTDNNLKPFCTCGENAAIYCGSKCNIPLPQIPESFIKEYTESKGDIKKVLVEYVDNGEEGWSGNNTDGEPVWNEKLELKCRPDNTIIIHPVKQKTYTREQVIKLIHDFRYAHEYRLETTGDIEEWIEENL